MRDEIPAEVLKKVNQTIREDEPEHDPMEDCCDDMADGHECDE